MTTKKAIEKEARVLYTIRLEPSVIKKIEAQAAKLKITHAAHARNMLNICVDAKHGVKNGASR